VASRCDLKCDYCYVYQMADRSALRQPRFMSERTLTQGAERIAEHATAHHLTSVSVVFHGGEPLLAGPAYLARAARTLRDRLPAPMRLDLRVQTHGGLLDDEILTTLAEHQIMVGVSLDGGPEQHDRHRRRADGRGTFAQTAAGLDRLLSKRFRALFSGLLCVVDLENDPVGVYEGLLGFAPPTIDFLLPHANWTAPPTGHPAGGDAPYGRWLTTAFDRWYDAAPQETAVRLFQDIIQLYLGGHGSTEQVGLSPAEFVVIDTDGALQQVDTLKSVRAGAAETGLHVRTHTMDQVLEHPGVQARQRGLAGLSETCRHCSLVNVCGGGAYVHRYDHATGFDNPSVYCRDMQHLIRHITRRVDEDLRKLR